MDSMVNFFLEGYNSFGKFLEAPLLLMMALIFVSMATYTDLKSLKIPNKLNGFFLVPVLITTTVMPLFQGDYKEALLALGGGAFGFMALLIPAVITGFKMAGDIKFIGVFGMLIGLEAIIPFLLVAVVFNILTNLLVIAIKKKNLKNIVPFAPFFATAFAVCIALSTII